MTSITHDWSRPQDLSAGLRKLADAIDARKSEQRHLGIVVQVPHPECPGMIGDIRYTGETAVISTRPMPRDLTAAVQRFFHQAVEFRYPARPSEAEATAAINEIRSKEPLAIPRQQTPAEVLAGLGIRIEEITPNSVIVISYKPDAGQSHEELNACALQISAMVDRPVVLQPAGFEISSMSLAECVKLRDSLNEVIYDKERAG